MAERDLTGHELAGREERPDHLRLLVRQSPLRVALVRLSDSAFLEVSDSFAAMGERSREQLLTERMLDQADDPERARRSFELLAAGTIDGYSRRGTLRQPDGRQVPLDFRISVFPDSEPRETAVLVLLSESVGAAEALAASPEHHPVVLGTLDGQWLVDRVTVDVEELLGTPATDLLGRSVFDVVHPDDVSALLRLAAQAHGDSDGCCGRIRLRTGDGQWLASRLELQPLAGGPPPAFAFSITTADVEPAGEPGSRARELEEHLRRIGREVAAAGVAAWSATVPTSLEVPELSTLTSREYEIVVRLASGQRVGAIARALFLSESTVRNHLTAVYRKFGVHNREGLLARLHGG